MRAAVSKLSREGLCEKCRAVSPSMDRAKARARDPGAPGANPPLQAPPRQALQIGYNLIGAALRRQIRIVEETFRWSGES